MHLFMIFSWFVVSYLEESYASYAMRRSQDVDRSYSNQQYQQEFDKIVWRILPTEAKIVLPEQELKQDFFIIHADAKQKVIDNIQGLVGSSSFDIFTSGSDESGKDWRSLKSNHRPGNFASATVQIIYEDGTIITEKVVPTKSSIVDISMGVYTTLKCKKDGKQEYITYRSRSVDALKSALGIYNGADYIDTELQICADFLFVDNPQLELFIRTQTKSDNAKKKIIGIILHIYSERDPCGLCGSMLVKLVNFVNNQFKKAYFHLVRQTLRGQGSSVVNKLRSILKPHPELWQTINKDIYGIADVKKLKEIFLESDPSLYGRQRAQYAELTRIVGTPGMKTS